MKRTFTKEYMLSNRGCYSRDSMLSTPFIKNEIITLKNLFDGLPINDFTWFFVRKCDLTLSQKKEIALHCAKQVLPIYEKQYPNDSRVRESLEATEGYINGTTSIEELMKSRAASASASAWDAAAAAAADAAWAAAAASAAAAAAASDAAAAWDEASAADAAWASAAAAAAASDAAAAWDEASAAAAAAASDAAWDEAYRKSIWEFCKTLK